MNCSRAGGARENYVNVSLAEAIVVAVELGRSSSLQTSIQKLL